MFKKILLATTLTVFLFSHTFSQTQNSAYQTGSYKNLFKEIGKTDAEIQQKIDAAWNQLFYGDDNNQRVYYPVGSDMAYIKDTGNNDVRSEGMSYGMMIAVQMNKQQEFNRLWKWSKTYMQHQSGPRKGYFSWQNNFDGSKRDQNPASDGEEYFATALFFAANRWGNGSGIFNYKQEAQQILDTMLHKEDNGVIDSVTNMFNKTQKQVVFVPYATAATFTDPSYHLPAFYELWALWADKDNSFWSEAAATSRSFFDKALHPTTGLNPDYAEFNGAPRNENGHGDFRFDAWRTIMNISVDQAWFGKNANAINHANNLQNFFFSKGISSYGNQFTLSGNQLSGDHSPGLVAMNATASLISSNNNSKKFVEELWNLAVPSGQYRYYDGLLYMMGLLHVSGNFRIYSTPSCSSNIAGDFTKDCKVNIADLSLFLNYYKKPVDDNNRQFDLTNDNQIGGGDLSVLLNKIMSF